MPAAEDERAGAVEAVEDRHAWSSPSCRASGRRDQQRAEDDQGTRSPVRATDGHGESPSRRRRAAAAAAATPISRRPRSPPPGRARSPQTSDHGGRRDGDRAARTVGGELPRHAPDRLGDDGDGHDLQAVQPAGVLRPRPWAPNANSISAIADGSVNPSHAARPPSETRPDDADADPDLAAGRAGQELAERHEVGERRARRASAGARRTRGGNSRCARSGRRTMSAPAALRPGGPRARRAWRDVPALCRVRMGWRRLPRGHLIVGRRGSWAR